MSDTAVPTIHGGYLMPPLPHATVADAIHPGIVSCSLDASLTDVARLMATEHVHCVVAMGTSHEEPAERFVWGLISDLDVLRAGIHQGPDASARALALDPIISVRSTMPLREAGELMLGRGVSHVIVIDPETQRPTGVLSSLDIIGALASGKG